MRAQPGDTTYADNTVRATWEVVTGSGTGELRGLSGRGGYTGRQEDYPNIAYTLECQLEPSASEEPRGGG